MRKRKKKKMEIKKSWNKIKRKQMELNKNANKESVRVSKMLPVPKHKPDDKLMPEPKVDRPIHKVGVV